MSGSTSGDLDGTTRSEVRAMGMRFGSSRWPTWSEGSVRAVSIAARRHRRAAGILVAALAAGLVMSVGAAPTVRGGAAITQTTPAAFTVSPGEPGYPGVTHFPIDVKDGSQVMTVVVSVPKGGSFGWHYHTAPLAVTVIKGTLTLYAPPAGYVEGVTPTATFCPHKAYRAGTGFFEEPGVVHLARNESAATAVISVTYLGIAPGTANPDVNKDAGYKPCAGVS